MLYIYQFQLGNCVLHVFSMKSAWLSGLFGAAFVCFVTASWNTNHSSYANLSLQVTTEVTWTWW